MNRSLYADPKTDFVFKRLFGTEEHKHLLIALLNDLLDRKKTSLIVDVEYLREEQRPVIEEMKYSIVDVKCRDARGHVFVVEMQVLNVESFEKRVVYNGSKAYVSQLNSAEQYESLNNVIAISICNFVLWPDHPKKPKVPLLSRWRMREKTGGREGLSQIQYVFVELPKFAMDARPSNAVEQWAYLFRHAATLTKAPVELQAPGPKQALEVAKIAGFTASEWSAYDRELMAERDARGRVTFAVNRGREEGRIAGMEEGRAEGRAEGIEAGRAEGIEAGRAEGRADGVEAGRFEGVVAKSLKLVARKLGRALTVEEQRILRENLADRGDDAMDDALLSDDKRALHPWIAVAPKTKRRKTKPRKG